MSTAGIALEAPRLLLVDDDEIFRAVLARALERRGFQVQAADCPAAALPWRASFPGTCLSWTSRLADASASGADRSPARP